jgi:hypothetical protein
MTFRQNDPEKSMAYAAESVKEFFDQAYPWGGREKIAEKNS